MQKDRHYSFVYRNGLTLVFITLFFVTLWAQAVTGFKVHNDEITELGAHAISFGQYLTSGHFISATFENFESEFLQMGLYVVLTVFLRQIGSAESKPMEGEDEVDREPVSRKGSPWPVRKGGWILFLYKYSLSICFFTLFLVSWTMHLYGSWQDNNVELKLRGKTPETIMQYLGDAHFWFEAFQNWQSEFLSIFAIVFFTIYLRQKGSPESKPVDAPHMETGK